MTRNTVPDKHCLVLEVTMNDPVLGGAADKPPSFEGEAKVEVFGKRPSSRSMFRYIRPTLWGLLVVYLVIFLLANRQQVNVNFVFFQAEAPLIVALLVSHIIGIVVGGGVLMVKGRRDRNRHRS
ncbi:MAG TPA: LapA family protein [Actinomycetota bacterium]|nr:LapA family protein [Actinomycetota bacterium]